MSQSLCCITTGFEVDAMSTINCQAYRSELTEFIELVQAGRDSELHRLEQKAMLRHPNVVRTTMAAEMSWKEGKTVNIADVKSSKTNGHVS